MLQDDGKKSVNLSLIAQLKHCSASLQTLEMIYQVLSTNNFSVFNSYHNIIV